jgi:ubiquinol-cytochrome c reductase iron-sulfur subunit
VNRSERVAAAAFGLAALAAIAFLISFWSGGEHTQLQGVLVAIALVGIGIGLVVWANRLMPTREHVEERTTLKPSPEERAALEQDMERGELIARRVWLRRSAVAAGGALGLVLLSPLRSLGPRPGYSLLRTSWHGGARVVDGSGQPVRAADVPDDGLLTVFPEGAVGSADSQTVLIRVDASLLHLPSDRADWAPDGLLAYSKVCSHAGCPVGLYESERHTLLCPCHQSSFDVLRGAVPISGPAAWPLPQLHLVVDADGILHATGDFSSPVGPGWWKP